MVIDMPAQRSLGNGPEADFLIEFFCLQIVFFAIQADDGFTRGRGECRQCLQQLVSDAFSAR